MKVVLKKDFFDGTKRYRSLGSTPIEIDDALFRKLPSTAEVVEPPKNGSDEKLSKEEKPKKDNTKKNGNKDFTKV